MIHICWLASGPGERGTSVDVHFLTVKVIHVVLFIYSFNVDIKIIYIVNIAQDS